MSLVGKDRQTCVKFVASRAGVQKKRHQWQLEVFFESSKTLILQGGATLGQVSIIVQPWHVAFLIFVFCLNMKIKKNFFIAVFYNNLSEKIAACKLAYNAKMNVG